MNEEQLKKILAEQAKSMRGQKVGTPEEEAAKLGYDAQGKRIGCPVPWFVLLIIVLALLACEIDPSWTQHIQIPPLP